MELKQIKELMAAMGRTGIKQITLKKENFELVLEREDHFSGRFFEPSHEFGEEGIAQAPWSRTDKALSRGSDMPARPAPSPISAESSKEHASGVFVTSPMVGTFYASPSPDDPPFVKVGDRVEKNTVVCIIEAMKVMNEIKANASGTIAEVLTDRGQPVEFGTKLFRVIE